MTDRSLESVEIIRHCEIDDSDSEIDDSDCEIDDSESEIDDSNINDTCYPENNELFRFRGQENIGIPLYLIWIPWPRL